MRFTFWPTYTEKPASPLLKAGEGERKVILYSIFIKAAMWKSAGSGGNKVRGISQAGATAEGAVGQEGLISLFRSTETRIFSGAGEAQAFSVKCKLCRAALRARNGCAGAWIKDKKKKR